MPSAVTKIATAAPTSGTSTSFSTISGSYDDLMIIGSAKHDSGSGAGGVYNRMYIRFNSDTGSSYAWGLLGGEGASNVSYGSLSDTSIFVYGCASYYSYNPGWGHFYVHIPGYKQTTSTKNLVMAGGYSQDNSQNSAGWFGAGNWNDTGAITDISFTSHIGDFLTGTTITLYGISNS